MSGIRAVDLGLLMPDGDDLAPARKRALSYDFSRWNNPSASWSDSGVRQSSFDDEPSEEPLPEPLPEPALGPVSFTVYTPAEIKLAPLPVRRTPPPPPDDNIKDVQEALAIAKSLGPKGLLARFGLGVAAGAVLLFAAVGLALFADDTPESRGILSARTDTPTAAPAIAAIADTSTDLELIDDTAPQAADSNYFELPDTAPAKSAKTARGGKKGGAKRALVRVSPF